MTDRHTPEAVAQRHAEERRTEAIMAAEWALIAEALAATANSRIHHGYDLADLADALRKVDATTWEDHL